MHSWAVPIGCLGPHPAGTTRGSGGYVPQNCPTGRRSCGKHPKVPDPHGWRWLPEASDLSAPRPHHPHSVCPPSPTAEHLLSEHLQLEQGRPAGAQGGGPAFSGLEEAHLLSACCAHLGGRGQGTAEVGARPGVAAVDPGLKQAPSMKSWSEGSLWWGESWGMWRRCV